MVRVGISIAVVQRGPLLNDYITSSLSSCIQQHLHLRLVDWDSTKE